jgi:hypothetical protein
MSPSGHLSLFIPMENLGDDLQLTNRNVAFTAEGFAAVFCRPPQTAAGARSDRIPGGETVDPVSE